MKEFFKTVLFRVNAQAFTTTDLLLVILILFGIFILNKAFHKRIRKSSLNKYLPHLHHIILFVASVFAVFEIIYIIDNAFWSKVLFKNKWFDISYRDFIYIFSVPVLSLLVTRLFRGFLLKPSGHIKRKTVLLLEYVIWTVALSYLAKALFADFEKISNYEIITIKKVAVTFFDIWFFTVIVSITSLIIRALKRFFESQAESLHIDSGTGAAILQITKYILWILAIVIILQTAGFDITLIIAGSAALLVGFGMGIQQVFGDITSGVILLVERPLKAGDVVQADSVIGIVQHIGVRTTTILTRDDTFMRIPNSKFIAEKLENFNDEKEASRFHVSVGVAYGSDVSLVMKILKNCAEEHAEVEKIPEPFARFENFGNSSLDFKLFFWSKENFRIEQIMSDIRVQIDARFREADVTIPFPQRDVHFFNHSED